MGTHHYHFRCNMATQMIRPPDRWASLVYPHHCRRPRGTSAGNRTLSAADNRRCQATCQFRWVAYPLSRHRRRRRTFLADGNPGPLVRTSTWGRIDGRQWKLDRTHTRHTRRSALTGDTNTGWNAEYRKATTQEAHRAIRRYVVSCHLSKTHTFCYPQNRTSSSAASLQWAVHQRRQHRDNANRSVLWPAGRVFAAPQRRCETPRMA